MNAEIESGLLAGEVGMAEQWELARAVDKLSMRIVQGCDAPTPVQVRRACGALNAARQFELCRVLAQAYHEPAAPDPAIVKHLVQAQINLSMLDAAQATLDAHRDWSFIPAGATKDHELLELAGLQARLLKDRFVLSQDRDDLVQAYLAYRETFDTHHSKPSWHGVNAVALGARAERDGVQLDGESSGKLAARLHKELCRKEDNDPWRLATLSELSLALGKCDQAELWLYRLLHAPKCTPFILQSYERQLRTIWEGHVGAGGCASRLLTILTQYQIRNLSTMSIAPDSARELRGTDLEKVFSDVGSFSVEMVRRMLAACESIGCVSNELGARLGTGFMLRAGDLGNGSDDRVFVTNSHVLSDTVPGAVPLHQALVSFELGPDAEGKPTYYKVSALLYTSPPGPLGVSDPAGDLLDVTIVRLDAVPATVPGLRIARALPLVNGKTRAYVIGHPRGSGLQVSVHDSELLACDEHPKLIHYRTPTDPGSSGSPVFNEAWQVIALHHGGSHTMPRFKPASGDYPANEGVTLAAIRAALAAHAAAEQARPLVGEAR
jgi:hypothetical protein